MVAKILRVDVGNHPLGGYLIMSDQPNCTSA